MWGKQYAWKSLLKKERSGKSFSSVLQTLSGDLRHHLQRECISVWGGKGFKCAWPFDCDNEWGRLGEAAICLQKKLTLKVKGGKVCAQNGSWRWTFYTKHINPVEIQCCSHDVYTSKKHLCFKICLYILLIGLFC